jgi:hypothetical protein
VATKSLLVGFNNKSFRGHFFGLLFFGPAKKSDWGAGRRPKRPLRKRQPGDTPTNRATSQTQENAAPARARMTSKTPAA